MIRKNKKLACKMLMTLILMVTISQSWAGEKPLKIETISGEELYKSFILGFGQFSSKMRILEQNLNLDKLLSASQKEVLNAYHDKLLDAIGHENPNYFDEFKGQILSSNPYLIRESLLVGITKMTECR